MADPPTRWRLLIYTVPSQPSRKRAFIWRELKKAGAVYLRDGVCALPERDSTAAILDAVASRVEEFGGEATVIPAVDLDARRSRSVIDASLRDRQEEYAEVMREAQGLLRHVERETTHRDFTVAELQELEADLAKLGGWLRQIQARDYFAGSEATEAAVLLKKCADTLAVLLKAAAGPEPAR